jgi:uracil-DNA glycosylase
VCTRCDLHRGTTHAVPGEGPADADIMFVGEGPGFNEDKQGKPFVGAAGKFLDELLGAAGLKRDEVYITNVVKHRPPNNRDPEAAEILACRLWLDRQIELVNPRCIVTLGRFSMGSFFPGSRISQVHGQLRERDGRYYFHMYHPAAALHRQELRQTLLDDMKTLGTFIQQKLSASSETGEAKNALAEAHNQDEEPEDHEQLSLF